MKAQDLRIRNYVKWNGPVYKEIARISFITNEEVGFWCGDTAVIQEIEPIPLTEEWLVKFGLTTITTSDNGDSNYWSKDNDLSVDVEPNVTGHSVETLFYYRLHEKQRRKHLMYVHQLQNLYFCLCGEELTIK